GGELADGTFGGQRLAHQLVHGVNLDWRNRGRDFLDGGAQRADERRTVPRVTDLEVTEGGLITRRFEERQPELPLGRLAQAVMLRAGHHPDHDEHLRMVMIEPNSLADG